ncbi:MAG: patatin-like phospholipase family protein [Acidobacteria bacterium]|nr:patatin-like phospholipase family protein [Acidobacteriota bacterium]MBI3657560.1 patatin-like phospholipase family protein [Acidobacteriota bacterium]
MMRTHGGKTRVGVILSAGGLRGAAHLGILRRLLRHGIPIDLLVGVSAGAIIAAFYAAVGLSIEEMIEEARHFRGRHIVLHGLTLRSPEFAKPFLRRFCGVIPRRLAQLESAGFDRLHHGVQGLGIVCHDLLSGRPVYFATGRDHHVTLAEVVKASAAIPGVIPSRIVERGGHKFRLVDGGLSDSLPIEFARNQSLGATHLIICDCRSLSKELPSGDERVYIKPHIDDTAILWSPGATLLKAVHQGEKAVTDTVLQKIYSWL